jgi:hypothetical protein
MTDARLPERWLNDRRLQRLSADHYRTYFNALLWSVANRTDGHIERSDVALIPHWAANAARELVSAGLFTAQSDGWLITDYASTQSSRDELELLERIRARDRQKKARKRAMGSDPSPGSEDAESSHVTTHVPGTVPGTRPGDSTGRQEGRQEGRHIGGDHHENDSEPGENENGESPRAESNGAESFTPTTEQLRRIDENVRRGYES